MADVYARLIGKPVGLKAVIGADGRVEALRKAIQKRGIDSAPDFITVGSADGGAGAVLSGC